mmetsp:Transcript_868/g.742  ORF Transcript_868/g.742 Transcript_868/m.742 type:complete len:113 (+) Transcript_868:84-422(+)
MPSGHSTAAGVIFSAIIVLFLNKRVRSLPFTFLYAALMVNEAYSRIYLNYHSLEQVIAGFSLGVLGGAILLHLFPISPPVSKQRYQRVEVIGDFYYEQDLPIKAQKYESLMI